MGEIRATRALGLASPWRLRRRRSMIAPLFASVVALALGFANMTGQATASATGQLAATPLAKATCSSTKTGNEAIVDLDSHKSFARLRTVCIGTLYGIGVIDGDALFVLHHFGPARDPITQVVRIDLTTYAVARSVPFVGVGGIFAGLGAIWVVTDSSAWNLLQLSPVSLRVLHRLADPDRAWNFLPFAGRLWYIDNYSLKTLNPTDGRISTTDLSWLPAGLSLLNVTSSGGELYLLASVPFAPGAAWAIATYNPVSGAHRVVRQPEFSGGQDFLGVTGRVLWVRSYRGIDVYGVSAYSARSLRPLTSGFVGVGPNSGWMAGPDAGDLWFQLAGSPLECASGKTGRLDARLRLPYHNLTEATPQPQGFVAADRSNLIVAATMLRGAYPSESGIAVYKLDPRCRA